MGLFDVLTGKRKIKQPAPDRLFAMSTAGVTLETELGLRSAGKAAIVFQPLGTADFDQIVSDTEEIVRSTGDETRGRGAAARLRARAPPAGPDRRRAPCGEPARALVPPLGHPDLVRDQPLAG